MNRLRSVVPVSRAVAYTGWAVAVVVQILAFTRGVNLTSLAVDAINIGMLAVFSVAGVVTILERGETRIPIAELWSRYPRPVVLACIASFLYAVVSLLLHRGSASIDALRTIMSWMIFYPAAALMLSRRKVHDAAA